MKKRYFPHIVLCIHGRIFCLISVLTLSVFWYQVFFNNDEFEVVGTAITAILSILTIFVFRFLWEQIWGEIVIGDDYIKFCGLFLPTVKLECDKINYIEIRSFSKGNVFYSDSLQTVDGYKFVLLSYNPLPNKRIDKIHSSKRNKIIKFAVSYKFCNGIAEKITDHRTKAISYQLYLYRKAKKNL